MSSEDINAADLTEEQMKEMGLSAEDVAPQQVTEEELQEEINLEYEPRLKSSYVQLQESIEHPERGKSIKPVSLLLNLGLWGSGIAYLLGEVDQGVFIFIAIVYFLEAMFAPTMKYLRNLYAASDLVGYIKSIQNEAPVIGFSCECYHYVTRTRRVAYTTGTGNNRRTEYRTETYTEKIVTWRESMNFHYNNFVDESGEVTEEIFSFPATRIDFSRVWLAGDDRTIDEYEYQKQDFIARNRFRDRHFSFWDYFNIPGYKDKMLALREPEAKPFIMNSFWYFIFVLLTLAWPYRLWLERQTAFGNFEYIKVVYA